MAKYTVWFRLTAPEWTQVIEADSEEEVYEKWDNEREDGKEFQVMECVESLGIDDFEIAGVEKVQDVSDPNKPKKFGSTDVRKQLEHNFNEECQLDCFWH